MAQLDFDATTVDPSTNLDAIPAGKYLAVIAESEIKPNSKGTGHLIKLAFQVIEGEYKGRKVFENLNIDHPNAQTVEIAKKDLSAICHAVGVLKPRISEELHNLPLIVIVGCRKRPDTDELANEIRGYAPREAAQGQPQQARNTTPPWRRNNQ